MPVRIIGMIGVAPPSGEATVHIIKGGISAPYLDPTPRPTTRRASTWRWSVTRLRRPKASWWRSTRPITPSGWAS